MVDSAKMCRFRKICWVSKNSWWWLSKYAQSATFFWLCKMSRFIKQCAVPAKTCSVSKNPWWWPGKIYCVSKKLMCQQTCCIRKSVLSQLTQQNESIHQKCTESAKNWCVSKIPGDDSTKDAGLAKNCRVSKHELICTLSPPDPVCYFRNLKLTNHAITM